MFIPIGHERMTVDRLPWITFGIIGLCMIIHVFVGYAVNEDKINEYAEEALQYYFMHPYLEMDPRLEEKIYEGVSQQEKEVMNESISVDRLRKLIYITLLTIHQDTNEAKMASS